MTPPTETSPGSRASPRCSTTSHRWRSRATCGGSLHPLPEILLLVVCGTIADRDDYEDIAAWGAAHLDFLRRHLPYEQGVPGERWLTILMNRINQGLFAAAFAGRMRETWPEKAGLVAIAGQDLAPQPRPKRGRRAAPPRLRVRHHRAPGAGARGGARQGERARGHPVAPRTARRRGRAEGGARLRRPPSGARDIDAIATNPAVAQAIADQGADWLLAVKANQPTLRAEVEAAFAAAAGGETHVDFDKGHGRIEERRTSVLRETDWLEGERRFPGEMRLPCVACLLRAETRVETAGATRSETRYFVSSRALTAAEAAEAVRGHWAIENRLHWVLDVVFGDDQSRLRRATAQETWPPSGILPSTSSAPPQTGDRSSPGESSQAGPGLSADHPRLTALVIWIRSPARGATGRLPPHPRETRPGK